MVLLPADILAYLSCFESLFSRPVWRHAQVLLARLCPFYRRRTA
jgi:hypothetical protein